MSTKIITVAATPPAESAGADVNKGAPLSAAEVDQNSVNLRAAVDRRALSSSTNDFACGVISAIGAIKSRHSVAPSYGCYMVANYSIDDVMEIGVGDYDGTHHKLITSGDNYMNGDTLKFWVSDVVRAILTAAGFDVSGAISATGNVSGANLITAGAVYASTMIAGASTIYLLASTSGVLAQFNTSGLTVSGTIGCSSAPPASASAAGVAGTITWDANYVYVCVATNTWKRMAISTW